jgi:hypothetical protein
MPANPKPKRPVSLDVYLGGELMEQVRQISDERKASQSAVCRELIRKGLHQAHGDGSASVRTVEHLVGLVHAQGEQLRRLEALVAVSVAVAATGQVRDAVDGADPAHRRAEFASVLRDGVLASASVLRSETLEAALGPAQRK